MPTSRVSPLLLLALLMLWSLTGVRGSLDPHYPWEAWNRICYTKDMSTEWLIAEDKGPDGLLPPESTVFHLLVPPHVARVGSHWEVTFDPAGKKLAQLAAHYDSTRTLNPNPHPFSSVPQSVLSWYLKGTNAPAVLWFIIRSRDFMEGRFTQPNFDPDHSGILSAYNLDPENAVGTSFLEPTVTARDGEWTLTFPAVSDSQRARLAATALDWMRHTTGPKLPLIPKIHYPPTIQKEYDAWQNALRAWQQAGGHGLSPLLEDFFHFTPEQQKQYDAWQRARSIWLQTGAGPFPQPSDFLRE